MSSNIKQYLRIIAKEVNVKKVCFEVTNVRLDGEHMLMEYTEEDDHIRFSIKGQSVWSEKLEEFAEKFVEQILNNFQKDGKERTKVPYRSHEVDKV